MKSPDGKNRLPSKKITKTCKECNKQVPTACKACPCGYHFRKISYGETYTEPSTANASSSSDAALGRRTQRTRRARPHFFDSLEYGTHVRRNKGQGSVLDSGGNQLRGWSKATSGAKNKVKGSGKSNIGVGKSKKAVLTNAISADSVASLNSISSDPSASKDLCGNAGGSGSSCSSRDEDFHGVMTAEKAMHYSIILAEINRKYSSVTFRPM